MSRVIRIFTMMAAIILMCVLATSCGGKTKKSESESSVSASRTARETKPVTSTRAKTSSEVVLSSEEAEVSSEEIALSSEEIETSLEQTEPSSEKQVSLKPEAPEGGTFHKSFELTYYLPDFLQAMKYNGVMGVYEFYTGTFNGSPTGLDFAVDVYDRDELKDETLETYVLTRSRAAKAGLKDIERVVYNGYEWLRLTNGSNATYYYAVFGNYLYCLLTLQGYDTAENYLTTRDMFEQTLFFSPVN